MFRKHRGVIIQAFLSLRQWSSMRFEKCIECLMRLWRTAMGILGGIRGRDKEVEIHPQVGNTCWFPQPKFPSPSNIYYPLGGEEGGTGQSSFPLRWVRVTCQPLAYATCISILYSKWHCGVNNSSNFHNKVLPIKAMGWQASANIVGEKVYNEWHAWCCVGCCGGTNIHQFMRARSLEMSCHWHCAHPHTSLEKNSVVGANIGERDES